MKQVTIEHSFLQMPTTSGENALGKDRFHDNMQLNAIHENDEMYE